ncbi:MAG: ATP-dependent protease [Gammaproteobacteria bacterium]|nr:ATP-dependent protease [Gammaproteobacteria bacterium]
MTLSDLKLNPDELNVSVAFAEFDNNAGILDNSILGQPRAQSALEFGIAMTSPGYNIFVMGEPGLGRLSLVTKHLNRLSGNLATPPAYVYVDNFANQREPVIIQLPPGGGQQFSNDIENLIDNLLSTFPSAFESPSYQQKKSTIERVFNQAYNDAIDLVEKRARTVNITLFRENETINFAPLKYSKPLDEAQFAKLRESERDAFHQHVEELEDYLNEVLLDLPQWRRTMLEKIKQLDCDTIQQTIAPLFRELEHNYQPINGASQYLTELKKHLNNTIADYLTPSRNLEPSLGGSHVNKRAVLVEMYAPNVLIDYPETSGAPVIYEPHPTYQNLFGRIEYINDQGTLSTSYRRICPGALQKANGGYLILDAEKLLSYPFVWDGLKRALQAGRIEIDSPYSDLNINTVTLKPQHIALNIKVILVGSRDTYYLLEELDGEFNEIFKVLADFDNYIPLNAEYAQQFAALLKKHTQEIGDQTLTNTAIYRLIEHSCRQSEHQLQLSAHINDSLSIVSEAQIFANQHNCSQIDNTHIERALEAREFRNGRLSQTMLNEMLDGTILIDTEGEAVGKINGLTIMEIGGSSFGAPTRITATVYPGSRGIVDIEREAELGQAIHSKGVLILSGYLGHCYAQQFPLAISANIAVEQSYGHIDGDSAALAELCCLISALTNIPVKQTFAITGSINQYGEVQAIGGVNEKIEGYFRLCKARGLTGKHAVIIPAANKRNLILKQEVIDAVRQNLFAVYAVATVAETLELITGYPAGVMEQDGKYPENSINGKAIARLKEIADLSADDEKEGSI